jgi:hypothetical protein
MVAGGPLRLHRVGIEKRPGSIASSASAMTGDSPQAQRNQAGMFIAKRTDQIEPVTLSNSGACLMRI